IQVQGLATRMRSTGTKKLVIGVSGGLDSTQALIGCALAMDKLKLPRRNILAYTMPGFATSTRTKNQAWQLMRAVGATAEEIDIRPACLQMLKDIGHPFAKGKKVYDIAFENVQAGERTSHLFRLANRHGGFVVGTGDLSELALGWSTYGVGDHMSHYNVNASVPKTLIQYLIAWVAESDEFSADVQRDSERAEGRLGRLALPAWRLACAVRRQRRGLAEEPLGSTREVAPLEVEVEPHKQELRFRVYGHIVIANDRGSGTGKRLVLE